MVRTDGQWVPTRGTPRVLGVHLKAGSPEGCNPFGRGLGVSPRTSYYSPFLEGRGLGGWCRGLMQRQAWARLGAMSDDDDHECAPNVEPEQ